MPCIVDLPCVEAAITGINDNLVNCNPDYQIDVIVHVDNHVRNKSSYTIEDVIALFGNNEHVMVSKKRIGLNASMKKLFHTLNEKYSYCVIIEDDVTIVHPVDLDFLLETTKGKGLPRLSLGECGAKINRSSENPFITSNVMSCNGDYSIVKNSRNFCSQNGQFFSKDFFDLLKGLDYGPGPSEVSISHLNEFKKTEIFTLIKNEPDIKSDKKWVLPLKSHMLLNLIRSNKARVGWAN